MARLLVVEDERKLLRSLQRGLEAEGYEVAAAANGDTANARLAAESFDAVILDWMLPGRDGLQVLAEVRRSGNRVPVLMLTAGDLEMDLLERRVTRGGEEVALRGREFEVLAYLARHRGQVVTRDMLGRDVWKEPQH